MKKLLFICCLILIVNSSFGQSAVKLPVMFIPMFGKENLAVEGPAYTLDNGSPVEIKALRFYISGVQLYQDNRLRFEEINSFHLIDAAEKQTLSFQLNLPAIITYNTIKFNVGIDSLTNVSGALGGDLDPTKGMYWTWQSGYINIKLEGTSPICKTRKNEFTFHVGGYQQPFQTLQTVSFPVKKGEPVSFALDIKKVLETIDLTNQNHIMSPNAEAVKLSRVIANNFSVMQP